MRSSQQNDGRRREQPWALLGLLPIVAVLVLSLKEPRHPANASASRAATPIERSVAYGCARAPGQWMPGLSPAPRGPWDRDAMVAITERRGTRVVSYGQPWEHAAAIALSRCPDGATGRA